MRFTDYVKRYAKADDIATKHGVSDDGSGSEDGAYLSSSDDEETPGGCCGIV